MAQTIGKRIAENRKKLGLTQDGLAEQLGVTAQAVSKWENDQSCPDITMLPKLADIFGITTDALLGRETQTVHEAEVVCDEDEEAPKHNWEFTWDAGRNGALGFACWVLGLGVLLLVNNIYQLGAGFWGLAWPSFLLMMGLFCGKTFSFARLGFVLLGGYFLVDNLGFMPQELTGDILWPALVILFGLSLVVDALRKPKKPKFRILHNGEKVIGDDRKKTSSLSTEGNCFECSVSFGEDTRYIELHLLQEGMASCSFGTLTVDLSGCEAVAPDCEMEISCAFGELILLVPKRFLIEPDSSTAFGSIEFFGQPDAEPVGVIQLDASTSFGHIEIRYI